MYKIAIYHHSLVRAYAHTPSQASQRIHLPTHSDLCCFSDQMWHMLTSIEDFYFYALPRAAEGTGLEPFGDTPADALVPEAVVRCGGEADFPGVSGGGVADLRGKYRKKSTKKLKAGARFILTPVKYIASFLRMAIKKTIKKVS